MPTAGFEPTIPASERPQSHALDRAATGIDPGIYVALIAARLARPLTGKMGLRSTSIHSIKRQTGIHR